MPYSSISIYTLDFYFNILAQSHNHCPYDSVTATRDFGRRFYVGTKNGFFFIVTFLPSHYYINVYNKVALGGLPRYMHILNESYLLSFGKNSGNLGLRLWVYDVTNPANPFEVGNFSLTDSYANSIAEFEHKAFLIYPDVRKVVVPLQNPTSFNGALVLTLNPGTPWTFDPYVIFHYYPGDKFYDRTVQRSLYVNEQIYTKSKCLIKSYNIYNNA